MDSERQLHYLIARGTPNECVDEIVSRLRSGARGLFVACANPHSLMVAERDHAFREALRRADLLVPDGTGIVLASRLLGGAIRNRVTGSDLLHGLCARLNQVSSGIAAADAEFAAGSASARLSDRTPGPFSLFFLGSTPDNLAAIRSRAAMDFPRLRVAGMYSPPFKPEFTETDDGRMVEAVNAVRPDVLWVGMTAPKQEKWIDRNRSRLDVGVILAVGAAFDFYSGRVRRASAGWRRLGLEWLPRLWREPRRLWRRNLDSPRFLWQVARERRRRGPSL